MLYEMTIPQFTKMLGNLERILDKAEQYAATKKFETEVLLQSRLAPDQFPLVKQLQIVCDTAKLCTARLTNQEAPAHQDNEKSFSDVRHRVADVKKYLSKFSKKDFEGAQERQITQARWEGKYLLGEEYVQQHALPNFYFHLTTAYAILRHNGVDVGKKDYLGELPFKK